MRTIASNMITDRHFLWGRHHSNCRLQNCAARRNNNKIEDCNNSVAYGMLLAIAFGQGACQTLRKQVSLRFSAVFYLFDLVFSFKVPFWALKCRFCPLKCPFWGLKLPALPKKDENNEEKRIKSFRKGSPSCAFNNTDKHVMLLQIPLFHFPMHAKAASVASVQSTPANGLAMCIRHIIRGKAWGDKR